MLIQDIKVFIFDWSGVISDDRKPVYEADMRILEAHGVQRMSYENWLVGPMGRQPMTFEEFFRTCGIIFESREERNRIFSQYYQEVVASGTIPVIYPDAKKALACLWAFQKKMTVVSAHPVGHLTKEIEIYDIRKFFADFHGGTSQDKAEELKLVCQNFKISPKNAAFIGDTIYDIASAKKAGVIPLAVSTGYHPKAVLMVQRPRVIANSLTELIDFLFPVKND